MKIKKLFKLKSMCYIRNLKRVYDTRYTFAGTIPNYKYDAQSFTQRYCITKCL